MWLLILTKVIPLQLSIIDWIMAKIDLLPTGCCVTACIAVYFVMRGMIFRIIGFRKTNKFYPVIN
ncbi:hypothetical protein MNB_SUP05-SYMBIONT-5-1059 [hydrothermal vent metagenome]|uniref:Uncharacterized protein n=1 Tax=hydrothermal vent metagenome TaxID=652676 RepID=A0A1W1E6M9_9ZZZZ